ncbi:MAG: dihydropteroate synthase [Candidatus Omnitrophica bacterium]|nr:dihydropteroate synthase [Candidatus Omnitrophota bacterium]
MAYPIPQMRILVLDNPKELTKVMQEIKVDPYGIKMMLPKALTHLIKINSLSNIVANILKQELLSIGGDVAIAKDALTGKSKKTDCLLIGNLAQFNRLKEKLNRQPFGLNRLGEEISSLLNNYQKKQFILELGRYKLNLERRTQIMGIVNLTPDSFSGDGLYSSSIVPRPSSIKKVIEFVENMVRDGADIIDLGGESTRPGARPISVKEELNRTVPVIKALAKKINIPISIDTYKPEVAQAALNNGADLVNDITGLRNPKMRRLVAKYKAGVVIMHMQGTPRTMQRNPVYRSLIEEILEFFRKQISLAEEAGIARDKIIIDPGIGFGKSLQHNLEILKRLSEFKSLGQPILVGTSRKSFIGKVLRAQVNQRLFGSVASCVLAAEKGAQILRVHDVKAVKDALKLSDTIK